MSSWSTIIEFYSTIKIYNVSETHLMHRLPVNVSEGG